ncbi:MAG: hypothetical protein NY202_03595 [Mollicutes bacterium UO1]
MGLVNLYHLDFPPTFISEKKDLSFNRLLLNFFAETNDLYLEENEQFYNLEGGKINDRAKSTYYS